MSTPRVVLVSFIGPRRIVDAAANAELPLRDLIGPVQDILGVDATTTGPERTEAQLLPAGQEAHARRFALTRSLDDLGAVDGDVITFTPGRAPLPPPS